MMRPLDKWKTAGSYFLAVNAVVLAYTQFEHDAWPVLKSMFALALGLTFLYWAQR